MRLIRSPALFALYPLLPHRLLGRAVKALAELRRPRIVVDAMTGAWLRRADVDLEGTERGPFTSIADAFGRHLALGGRPIGDGIVSPVDGEVMSVGAIAPGVEIVVKGLTMTLDRVVNGTTHTRSLSPFHGGTYVVIFLSPRGYHHVHAPLALRIRSLSWIPGRYFPQNHDALRAIPRVYERNERVTIDACTPDGHDVLLVMVAASLVGGIEVLGQPIDRDVPGLCHDADKGERLGSFSLGSTVVLLLPPALAASVSVREGDTLRMGAPLSPIRAPMAVGTRLPS